MRALELTLPTGLIRGFFEGDVAHWRGIPFAAPPTGALRWQAPQPPEPWSGFRECQEFGPICPQPGGWGLVNLGQSFVQDEDCLTLNVTAPASPDGDGLPVMVYVHGGAFVHGAGSEQGFDGSALVRRGGIVYVSLNYRLGAWGWMHFDEYAGDDLLIDSNLGLRDILAALGWVKENIAVFGGDPDRITVFGESAGAIALAAILAVPSAAGLFAGAILQSGAPRTIPTMEQAHRWASEFVGFLGVDPGDPEAVRTRLRTVDQQGLITALDRLSRNGPIDEPTALPVVPAADGLLLPRLPVPAIADGQGLRVPLIIGTNDREGTLFAHLSPTTPALRPTWRLMSTKAKSFVDPQGDFDRADQAEQPPAAVLKDLYPGLPKRGPLADLAGDGAFWYPSIELAEAHAAHAPTWSYRFDFSPWVLSAIGLNATHGVELAPIFGRYDAELTRFWLTRGDKKGYARLSASIQDQWLHFAHHQRPGDDWPRYDVDTRSTLIFDAENRIEHDPRSDRRQAWKAVTHA
ncbi:MAG: carboxylesterase/lipase family protein [Propionibacteriaceae bacterium]|nr:carboxylesterase/lipase family protein [Propionibacteriaceae bacterium]